MILVGTSIALDNSCMTLVDWVYDDDFNMFNLLAVFTFLLFLKQ